LTFLEGRVAVDEGKLISASPRFPYCLGPDILAAQAGGRVNMGKSDHFISVEDYLGSENDNPFRREYVEGRVYAMGPVSDSHNCIAINVASRLNQGLADGPCEVFISDMKLRAAPNVYYYPDVMVCSDSPPRDSYLRAEPVLIVEVMSCSTARVDRHEKSIAY